VIFKWKDYRAGGRERAKVMQFEPIPDIKGTTAPVSHAYAEAYKTAVQQAAIPPLFEGWAAQIADTYPFHPGMQETAASRRHLR
jgi:hypothetical protein